MTDSPFLCIFALPKPFVGVTAVQQRNAIASWVQLGEEVEVLLCGEDEGVAETAAQFGVRHEASIRKTDLGTPLVSAAFEAAAMSSTARLLCYVNADIIFMSDFVSALRQVRLECFLLCGRRWDLDLETPLDFQSTTWEIELRHAALNKGCLHEAEAMDYFAFPRGGMAPMPPFVVGRAMWDNWFVFNARVRGMPVIDATRDVVVVHQNHGYAHTSGGQMGAWYGQEAQANRALAREMLYPFTIKDATHALKDGVCAPRTDASALAHRAMSGVAIAVRQRPAARRLLRKLLHAKDV